MKTLLFVITLFFSTNFLYGELLKTFIVGERMQPKTIVISVDDGPYENWQSSGNPAEESWTLTIAKYLASIERQGSDGKLIKGVPAIWFLVSCHFRSQALSDLRGTTCLGDRDVEESLIYDLLKLGHSVGNHTHSHLVAEKISESDFIWELSQTQYLLDKFQADGLHLFRPPGLNYPDWAPTTVNADQYLRKLRGPVGVDVGGAFKIGDEWMGGDWDCYDKGLTTQQCGDLYLRDIRETTQTHGAILLFHNSTFPGEYAFRLIKYIMENLDPDIQVVDVKTHPSIRLPPRWRI